MSDALSRTQQSSVCPELRIMQVPLMAGMMLSKCVHVFLVSSSMVKAPPLNTCLGSSLADMPPKATSWS